MIDKDIKKRAKNFSTKWLKHRGYEKGETASFWRSLLHEVFNVADIDDFIEFERKVSLGFIDGFIPSTKVLIEQKGKNIDLTKRYTQSDGTDLTPFQQAKRYADELPNSKRPRWIVVCNFGEFRIYDLELENPEKHVQVVNLEDLGNEYHRLMFLVDSEQENVKKQNALSFQAGEIVGMLYDKLIEQYEDPSNPETLKSLNKLCVRLVFCLYAEDAGLFATHEHFHAYFSQATTPYQRRQALIDLFRVLNTKESNRGPYLDETLSSFPYVNGGLFADEHIEIPLITDEIADLILTDGSENFNWANISPTIFGSLFESTLNPITRREGGMHYTSIENIHKVIDPLFLNDLENEFREIKKLGFHKKLKELVEFQQKLASLKFLDPACGSGNFLTETYICLRRLENKVISLLSQGQQYFSDASFSPIRVSISQFYGIEINDFAVSVAQTALWIAESQMRQETEEIIKLTDDFLPLKSLNHIVEGNALRIDWNDVVPSSKLSYIMGNPPFVGTKYQSKEHKSDVLFVNPKLKSTDYVACWFYKAALLCQKSNIKVALVATNSITQGEQVEPIWDLLLHEVGVSIDFAYRTFRWDSEATTKAQVHCVIIGFSKDGKKEKLIFNNNRGGQIVANISPYLVDAPNIIIKSRTTPLFDVKPMMAANKPCDYNHLKIEPDELATFKSKCPKALKWIKQMMGAQEFINSKERYCLWLVDCPLDELFAMPLVMDRVEACRQARIKANTPESLKLANTPTLFREQLNPNSYLLLPCVSSEKRTYIPMGFLDKNVIPVMGTLIIPEADLYDFGVLTSSVHMAWTRAVCGRLKSDYRYSKDVVYNNFVWPKVTESQKEHVKLTAQKILEVRDKYRDKLSLAKMYDAKNMLYLKDLVEAHEANDKAVMEAYGFSPRMSEEDIVAALFRLYEQKVAKLQN